MFGEPAFFWANCCCPSATSESNDVARRGLRFRPTPRVATCVSSCFTSLSSPVSRRSGARMIAGRCLRRRSADEKSLQIEIVAARGLLPTGSQTQKTNARTQKTRTEKLFHLLNNFFHRFLLRQVSWSWEQKPPCAPALHSLAPIATSTRRTASACRRRSI